MQSELSKLLTEMLEERQSARSSLSLRSFAKSVDLLVSVISKIINGKALPSKRTLDKIAQKLNFDPMTTQIVNAEIVAHKCRTSEAKNNGILALGRLTKQRDEIKELEQEEFELVSDWHYSVILEYLSLKQPPRTLRALAKVIGQDELDTINFVKNLIRAGQLKLTATGTAKIGPETICTDLVATYRKTITKPATRSRSVRRHHKQATKAAYHAIDHQLPDRRHYCTVTMAIDDASMHKLKAKIDNLYAEAMQISSKTEGKQHVYALTIQLFEAIV